MAQDPAFGPSGPGGLAPDDVWWLRARDGLRLRAALWQADAPRGHAIFLTGRTEFLEKITVPAAELVRRGWSVASLDWRGQGLSDRQTDNRLKGHVNHFADFQMDLDAFLADPKVAALPGPRVLMAHSMGGAIGCAALARPELAQGFQAAVLSAPMLGIRMVASISAAAWLTMRIGTALGKAKAWPPFGDVATPYILSEPSDNLLTADPAIWGWLGECLRADPDLALAMPTIGWFGAAFGEMKRLSTLGPAPCPTLILLGEHERVVDPAAVRTGAARLGADLAEIPGAQHELLIERGDMRALAWTEIDGFLARNELSGTSGNV